MSRNYSKWLRIVTLPAWVFVGFVTASLLAAGFVALLSAVGLSLKGIKPAVLNFTFAALLYSLTLAIVIGVPWFVKKHRTNMKDLGLGRRLSWNDIITTPFALVIYLVFSSLLIFIATNLLPWFDIGQAQETGFDQLTQDYELILAFMTLVAIAPFAEEALFRGYLYGKLRKSLPIWASILITSILFGAVHGAWNVAIDTFALSVIMCLLREKTGSIWASILLHMLKNGIAFYILFINPVFLTTIGG